MLLISSRKFTHLGDCLFSLDLSTLELKSRCSHPVPATFQSESRLLRRRARVFMCFSFLHIANLRKNPEGSVFPSGFYDNLRKSCGSAALLCQCLMDQRTIPWSITLNLKIIQKRCKDTTYYGNSQTFWRKKSMTP